MSKPWIARLWCFIVGHRTVNDMLAERGFPRVFPVDRAPCERCGKANP